MKAKIEINGKEIQVDFSCPLDISIPLCGQESDVSAWYVDAAKFEPVRTEHFLGSVAEGGTVNFRNIFFNPHGNGTHTECVGHIADKVYSINQALKTFFFTAELVTIEPVIHLKEEREWVKKGDLIITKDQIAAVLKYDVEAIVIRTLPNLNEKTHHHYSNTNWAYLEPEAAQYLVDKGIKHLLIDLPSVDREEDGGKMLSHRAFWNYPDNIRHECTITEMVYVPSTIEDGKYLLNLQIASFENDASPSKPILYQLF